MPLETVLSHVKNDVTYPASRKALLAACNNMSDVPTDDKAWVTKMLPEGTYRSADDVMRALMAKV